MKLKIKVILNIISGVILFSGFLAGCNTSKEVDKVDKVEENAPITISAKPSESLNTSGIPDTTDTTATTDTAATANTTATIAATNPTIATADTTATISPTNPPSIEPMYKTDKKSNIDKLSKILPWGQNIELRYTGSNNFGYKMRASNLEDTNAGKLLRCTGMFKNSVQNGKGVVFNIEYYITEEGIVEKISKAADIFPNPIKEVTIIKESLEKNTYWEQEVDFPGVNNKVKLEARVFDITNEGGKNVYDIRYAANVEGYPNNVYMEERLYKENTGLINFACIDKDGKILNYYVEKIIAIK